MLIWHKPCKAMALDDMVYSLIIAVSSGGGGGGSGGGPGPGPTRLSVVFSMCVHVCCSILRMVGCICVQPLEAQLYSLNGVM